ncbi:MAG: SBBP repeat-containing protein, partial [Pseudomonadota bacterium]
MHSSRLLSGLGLLAILIVVLFTFSKSPGQRAGGDGRRDGVASATSSPTLGGAGASASASAGAGASARQIEPRRTDGVGPGSSRSPAVAVSASDSDSAEQRRPTLPEAAGTISRIAPPIVAAAGPGSDGHFVLRDRAASAFFVESGLALALVPARDTRKSEKSDANAGGPTGWGLHWSLAGTARQVAPQPSGELPGKASYFVGPASEWRTGLPTYSRMTYASVLPGIDMTIEAQRHGVEYRFVVQPGARVDTLRMQYRGAKVVRTTEDEKGLEIETGVGTIREVGLACYQETAAGRREVEVRYAGLRRTTGEEAGWEAGALAGTGTGAGTGAAGGVTMAARTGVGDSRELGGATWDYGFEVGDYDRTLALVVDPVISWSSYLGGGGTEYGEDIAVDSSGNAYVVGTTASNDFPVVVGGFDTSFGGVRDAVVAKVDVAGASPSLAWSSFLGGNGDDYGQGVFVDGSGNVYVTGGTWSTNNFPTDGGFDTTLGGSSDAFIAKVNAGGSSLAWSSFLGGNGDDFGNGVAVDGAGNVYVAGIACSDNFPTDGGFDTSYGGACDAFIAKVIADGSSLAWSSFLGGNEVEEANAIALDSSANAYLVGYTKSSNFPSTGGFDTSYGENTDAFVTKVDKNGVLLRSSFLGGEAFDQGEDVAVDGAGNAFVTGYTSSTFFPTTGGGFDSALDGSTDAFVAKVSAPGFSLAWSSYLGGGAGDSGRGVAVDGAGNAYVTG